ncbi:MAG: hypothetical protein WCR30_01900 [Clostridia bacterium]
MIKEKLAMLKDCIKNNLSPIMIENVTKIAFKNAVVIPADCKIDELGEKLINNEWTEPSWLVELLNKSNKANNILVIDDLTTISKDEQAKFCEILKYKKVGKFELPRNCVIIVLAKKVSSDTINPLLYSLTSHI